MKYIVIIGDGMADWPIDEIDGLTVLQKASIPNMDRLAVKGVLGTVRTIPIGMPPGSDVANLSIMGYDPAKYYTGRAPLEAASMGIPLGENDVAYRCNLVTIEGDESSAVMKDHSSGHITTEEGRELISAVSAELKGEGIDFYPGVSYRHLMVWKDGNEKVECTPPHDILERRIADYLPRGDGSGLLKELMTRSAKILAGHAVNAKRSAAGKRTATSIWLWGQGRRPAIPTFREKYELAGALISAVDLTKGLGVCAGLKIIDVPGATGWIDTNYAGKAEYAVKALQESDFVYIHLEAPDEAGHAGSLEHKIRAVEDLDALIIGPVFEKAKSRYGDVRLLIMPDHATPIKERTHTDEPVPFIIYDSRAEKANHGATYDESIATREGIMVVDKGYSLMDYFIKEARV
ncbi:MAG TPA: cofactor-independent phosphoglycerate mutase [Dissulfurispiraceae bacterium]|nr:cofactor-independent phosphoglycerate mutase [Dissulfurispiraceae bacterium]